MDQEVKCPMTQVEERRYKACIPRETITEERIWNKIPDGLAIKVSTPETVGEFVILEFKRMSCVTDQCHGHTNQEYEQDLHDNLVFNFSSDSVIGCFIS